MAIKHDRQATGQRAALPVRVVITGYGPFGDVVDNPSARLAREVALRGVAGAQVEHRTLEVEHGAVDAFVAEMEADPPDLLLGLGLTRGQPQLEDRPENRIAGGRQGETRSPGLIVDDGPAEHACLLPVEAIEVALADLSGRTIATRAGLPGYTPDRSGYLCNYFGYRVAAAFGARASEPVMAGFVHVGAHTTTSEVWHLVNALVAHRLRAVDHARAMVAPA